MSLYNFNHQRTLYSQNKIVRYWAVLGLRNQSSTVLQKHREALQRAMKDPYLPVAITASAILYDVFATDQATVFLEQILQSK